MRRGLFDDLAGRRGWWQREWKANRSDYAVAVLAVMLLLFGIFGPVARGVANDGPTLQMTKVLRK